ncbi:Predicted P-loop ATPase and inactivated derivatives [Duganella sp. CF458]|uniref:VapE domain-containing protein n=1 Tax=Duganella sp. CF458 TaxID=1884368 RepID=UPI0008E0C793|nr:VapE domain-containing protein [Duganella sp. CF458]SFG30006.1 Predicted P-loop ATPase and inactivated derivatives [Duganella sp. CF458]
MTLDDFSLVGRVALDSIHTLLQDWFPNGVKEGHEFCIGSRDGEAGQSLRIRLTGDKAGVWSDFSDGAAGGDLISLYAFIHDLKPGQACKALAELLSISLSETQGVGKGLAKASGKPVQPRPNLAPAQADKGVQAPAEDKKRTPWTPILPVPDGAGPYPKAHVVRGRPEAHWEYRNVDGQLLGVVFRFLRSDGKGKEVLPCVFAERSDTGAREWRWLAFPEPRPLYQRGPARPDSPMLIVEGEKCVDRAVGMPGLHEALEVVSWSGGAKAVKKSDWSRIRDRNVILWPDADAKRYKEGHEHAGELMPEHEQPGVSAMLKIAEILRAQGCDVFMVDIPPPGQLPDGWDIADLIDGGASEEEVIAWTTRLRPAVTGTQEVPKENSHDAVPAWLDEQSAAQLEAASTPLPAGAGSELKGSLRDHLIGTANGGVKGCRENVYMVMQHDEELRGLVALDLFSGLQVKRRKAPWATTPGEWTESDDFMLGMYTAKKYGLVVAARGDIEAGVAQAARDFAFDPVVDYLDRCAAAWDGRQRVATALTRYWSAEDSEYMRLVSTMFFIGVVMRGYKPGVKNDHAPVFEGGQGEGKSTALKVLGGDWFADTPFRMGEKDGYLSIQGVLLYEVAELEQFNRSEVTAIKAFMSSTVDRFREPYGRRMKNVLRRCAFAATTNEDAYFKDSTGNRRFWPVNTGKIDIEALKADRDQLFGEAIALMHAGVQWWPTKEQQRRLIDPVQDDREIPDPWRGRLYEYVEGKDSDGKPTLAGKLKSVTARELLTRALHFEMSKLGPARAETMRVGAIMRKLGWIKRREPSGAREWYYERPAAEAAHGVDSHGEAQ